MIVLCSFHTIPPRKAPSQRGNDANKDQAPLVHQVNDPLDDKVSNVEFQTVITMLADVMTNQANQGVVAPPNAPTPARRAR